MRSYYLVGSCQKLVAKMIHRSVGCRSNNNADDNSDASKSHGNNVSSNSENNRNDNDTC
jgi:hypothetical protein